MISVIIATHNRRPLLAETLEAVGRQEMPGEGLEVLVVDNASADGTSEMVADLARRSGAPEIRLLHEERPGKSRAVNTAVAAARGRILVCTDDDVLPDRGWVRAIVEAMDETMADFAVGRIRPRWEVPPPGWISPALYGVLAVPDNGDERFEIRAGVNEQAMPIGANMAVRAEVVARLGGWRADLGKLQRTLRSGEDHEFYLRMLRAGMRGVYEPRASVAHLVPAERLRRAYFARWLYDNGRTTWAIEQEYPTTPHLILRVPRHLWREVAVETARFLRTLVAGNPADRFSSFTRMLWFAGYLRAAFTAAPGRRARAGGVPAVTGAGGASSRGR